MDEQERLNNLSLQFDDNGRIAGVDYDQAQLSTRAFDRILSSDLCKVCWESGNFLISHDEELDSAFWLPATASPRSMHEAVAQSIFRAHTQGVDFNPTLSGAEWWVVIRDAVNENNKAVLNNNASPKIAETDETEHGGGAEGIDFHFDKDVVLAGLGLPFVHPTLSTVTYLTSQGAPTCVCPIRRSLGGDIATNDCRQMIVSHPLEGKHLVFDGRFLHGVPESLNSRLRCTQPRVTFLVNIWLNYKPFAVQRFPFEDFPQMLDPLPPLELDELQQRVVSRISTKLEKIPLICVDEDFKGETTAESFLFRMSVDGVDRCAQDQMTLHLGRVPKYEECLAVCADASTFEFQFETTCQPLLVATPMKEEEEEEERVPSKKQRSS